MIRALLTLCLLLAPSLLAAQAPATMRSGLSWPPGAPTTITLAPTVSSAARFKASAEDVTIGPVTIVGAMRAVETDQGVEVRNSRIIGLVGRDLQRDGIRLRKAVDVEISGFDLTMRSEPQTGDQLPEGIAIYAGSGIVIRDGTVAGFRMVPEADPRTGKPRYENGDGIATEREASGTITRVISRNNSDGGFDLKGTWEVDALTTQGNGKGLRVWNTVTAGTLTSIDDKATLHLAKNASLTIDRLVARSIKPGTVIVLESTANLTIGSCDLTGMAKGSALVHRNDPGNSISLGAGCELP